jgi:hypothetical protein
MSKSRMLLAAAVAALAVMLIGGAGPAAAQTSPNSLAKTVKLRGTAENGKKFNSTYTIKRFTRSGSKVLAVSTVKCKIKGRKVTKKNVKIPVKLQRHTGATTSQLPNPTPAPARSSTWCCSRSTSTCSACTWPRAGSRP